MVRELYVHEINVPESSAIVEVDANGPVFLVTFAACAGYIFGGPLNAIRGPFEKHHVELQPTQPGSWYLAASSPWNGRYRFVLTDGAGDWVDFYLKVAGFG
jgi:hypothetical protein